MSTIDNQPENLNILSGVAFRFAVNDIPNVNFFCQSAQLPGISLGEIAIPTMHTPIFKAGNITFDPLAVRFIVDEDLKNYLEIYDWIRGLGHPTSFNEYKEFRTGTNPLPVASTNKNFVDTSRRKSDATLTVLTNKLNGNIQVTFKDCFPVSLGSIDFDLTNADISSIVVSVSFRYTSFSFETTV